MLARRVSAGVAAVLLLAGCALPWARPTLHVEAPGVSVDLDTAVDCTLIHGSRGELTFFAKTTPNGSVTAISLSLPDPHPGKRYVWPTARMDPHVQLTSPGAGNYPVTWGAASGSVTIEGLANGNATGPADLTLRSGSGQVARVTGNWSCAYRLVTLPVATPVS